MRASRLIGAVAALLVLVGCNDSALPPGATYSAVQGVVVDSVTNAPVANATITVLTVLHYNTQADGKFEFKSVPVGDFGYTVSAPGYKTTPYLTAHVDAGKPTELTIKLDPAH
jgi:Carboxypeptidase regulatory-like domain